MDENTQKAEGLTEEERLELEELRAEKAARAAQQQADRDRMELERLRAEKADEQRDQEAIRREAAQRERGRKLMEPDDDLRMPVGQKIVIAAVIAIAVFFVLSSFFS